jgi:branched-chain amino acid transport system substrate-binding protein
MKELLSLAFILLISCTAASEEIVIGSTLPITGDLSMYGAALLQGIQMAVDELNADGIPVKLVALDNAGDPKKAITDLYMLDEVNSADGVMTSFEYITLASKHVAEERHLPMISFTVYRFSQEDSAEWVFRDFWDMGRVGADFGKVANQQYKTKAAIVGQDDSSFVHFKEAFEEVFSGEIISTQRFLYGEKDYRSMLALIPADTDILLFYGFPLESSILLRQAGELGITLPLLLTEGTEKIVMRGNEEVLRRLQAVSYQSARLSGEKAFIEKYFALHGYEPRPDVWYAYENTKLLAGIVLQCDKIPSCVQENLSHHFDAQHNKFRTVPLVAFTDRWRPI